MEQPTSEKQTEERYEDGIVFNQKDLFLNPTDKELAYRRRNDEEKKSVAWGQRKLLLCLIQFLTLFWDPKKVAKPVIVYAGAAPGTNIGAVSAMFPEAEFHLYDPREFKVSPSDKIKIYQQYFTNEDAKRWTNRADVYFISDIRTADYTTARNLDENEKQIQEDMKRQMDWFRIINPVEGHLKFRLPYTGGDRPSRVNYLYGYVLKQPWAPQTTTETRLVPARNREGNWMIATWSSQKYQDQMFYHNVVVREKIKYLNPFTGDLKPIDQSELLTDWDSRCEAQIWMDYLQKRSSPVTSVSVVALSRLATKKLTLHSKFKDNLQLLRLKPQLIKKRNIKPSRDDIGGFSAGNRRKGTERKERRFHSRRSPMSRNLGPTKEHGLAKEIGLK